MSIQSHQSSYQKQIYKWSKLKSSISFQYWNLQGRCPSTRQYSWRLYLNWFTDFRVNIFHPDRKESVFLKSSEGFRITTQFPPMEWSHVSLIVFPCSQYLKILSNLLLFLTPTTPVGKAIICNLRDIYHHSCKVSITLKRQDCFSTFYWGSLNGGFILGMWNFTRLLCACTLYNACSTGC